MIQKGELFCCATSLSKPGLKLSRSSTGLGQVPVILQQYNTPRHQPQEEAEM